MFNYWTEGGFIAWGQEPDPETGRTPLQLFMDGRAQAAYDVKVFDDWSDIFSGGPLPYAAMVAHRQLTADEYKKIDKWVSERLRKRGIWVILIPDQQFDKPFTLAFDLYSQDWRTVYTDDKQKMFVDVTAPQGAALVNGMFTGQTKYPNEYLRHMAMGHNLLLAQDNAKKKEGLEYLIQALNEYPSPAPMKEILFIGRIFPELRARIDEVCQQYAVPLEKTRATYAGQDGYNFHLHVARMALADRAQVPEAVQDAVAVQTLRSEMKQYDAEIDGLQQKKKW
jgi:hypothetical protein